MTTTQYRIRWGRGPTHKTRYYTQLRWASKAAEKYRSKGYEVVLDEQEVRVIDPWHPVVGALEPVVARRAKLSHSPIDDSAYEGDWDEASDRAVNAWFDWSPYD